MRTTNERIYCGELSAGRKPPSPASTRSELSPKTPPQRPQGAFSTKRRTAVQEPAYQFWHVITTNGSGCTLRTPSSCTHTAPDRNVSAGHRRRKSPCSICLFSCVWGWKMYTLRCACADSVAKRKKGVNLMEFHWTLFLRLSLQSEVRSNVNNACTSNISQHLSKYLLPTFKVNNKIDPISTERLFPIWLYFFFRSFVFDVYYTWRNFVEQSKVF